MREETVWHWLLGETRPNGALNFIKSESEPILHAEQQFETSVMIAVVVLTALLALISGRRTDSRGRGSPVKSCAAAQTISANAAAVERHYVG